MASGFNLFEPAINRMLPTAIGRAVDKVRGQLPNNPMASGFNLFEPAINRMLPPAIDKLKKQVQNNPAAQPIIAPPKPDIMAPPRPDGIRLPGTTAPSAPGIGILPTPGPVPVPTQGSVPASIADARPLPISGLPRSPASGTGILPTDQIVAPPKPDGMRLPGAEGMSTPGMEPVAPTLEGDGLTADERMVQAKFREFLGGPPTTANEQAANALIGQRLGGGYQAISDQIKEAMFSPIKRKLDEDYRSQLEAMDRDLIRRGFGLNSGEAIAGTTRLAGARDRALADALAGIETYADQARRGDITDALTRAFASGESGRNWARGSAQDLYGFAQYARGNEQAALDREYNDWLRGQQSLNDVLGPAFAFAGLNAGTSPLATEGLAAFQRAIQNRSDMYGDLGAWGSSTLQQNWPQILQLLSQRPEYGSGYSGFGDFRTIGGG